MNPRTFTLSVLVSLSFWGVIYNLWGWLGVGVTLMVMGGTILLLIEAPRPPHLRVIEEQRIGAFDKTGRFRLSRAEQRRLAA